MEKISEMRQYIQRRKAHGLLVSALDEVACIFSLFLKH